MEWKPTLREPSMLDAEVQARLNAARGKYAIVVPQALEEKLENNLELSQSIMEKISALIKEQERNILDMIHSKAFNAILNRLSESH